MVGLIASPHISIKNMKQIITRAEERWGMGDALNLRAFIVRYCKEKEIKHKDITIYSKKHTWIFDGLGFNIDNTKEYYKKLTKYRNFGYFDLKKKKPIEKLDVNIAVNSGINYSFDVCVPLQKFNKPNIKLPKKYITFNTGFGELSYINKINNYISLKSWPISYWEYLIKNIGVPCIQLGCRGCKEVKGVALNLVGKLSIKESAEIMRGALFHIDMEGGLSILNQHLGKKSVVLFGPTAIQNQGRSFNLNIRCNNCAPCYEWAGHRHNKLCVKRTEVPCDLRCMFSLKPEYVLKKIYETDWITNGAFIDDKFMEKI